MDLALQDIFSFQAVYLKLALRVRCIFQGGLTGRIYISIWPHVPYVELQLSHGQGVQLKLALRAVNSFQARCIITAGFTRQMVISSWPCGPDIHFNLAARFWPHGPYFLVAHKPCVQTGLMRQMYN